MGNQSDEGAITSNLVLGQIKEAQCNEKVKKWAGRRNKGKQKKRL